MCILAISDSIPKSSSLVQMFTRLSVSYQKPTTVSANRIHDNHDNANSILIITTLYDYRYVHCVVHRGTWILRSQAGSIWNHKRLWPYRFPTCQPTRCSSSCPKNLPCWNLPWSLAHSPPRWPLCQDPSRCTSSQGKHSVAYFGKERRLIFLPSYASSINITRNLER